jgi:restriction system protein
MLKGLLGRRTQAMKAAECMGTAISPEWASVPVTRASVVRYKKSNRYAALSGTPGFQGTSVVYLADDLRKITGIKTVKFVRRESYDYTGLTAEILYKIIDDTTQYRLFRILEASDIDLERWKNTSDLSSLPVSEHPELTREELAWAGAQESNIGEGILFIFLLPILFLYIFYLILSQNLLILMAIIISVSIARSHNWQIESLPNPEKLAQLNSRKKEISQRSTKQFDLALLSFEKRLNQFGNWESLSALEFELALKFRLEKENYKVSLTRASRDGGIDLEGTDNFGHAVIVQAKKYTGKVGVAVVREMIGVRLHHPQNPRTIIYALSGFTKGATDLAEKAGVELRDIRKETLKL